MQPPSVLIVLDADRQTELSRALVEKIHAATMRVPLLNPRLKKAFARIAHDAADVRFPALPDVFVAPMIPKALLLKIKEPYERKAPQVFAPNAPG